MIPKELIRENGPYHAILAGSPEQHEQLVPHQLERLIRYRPDWLIPGYLRCFDGSTQLCLDITGLKPLDQTFAAEERSSQLGLVLLESVCTCLLEGQDCLLPAAQFSLHPSLIYLDDSKRVRLIFWPFSPAEQDNAAPAAELQELTATLADAFNWPGPAVAAAVETAGSGPSALLSWLQEEPLSQADTGSSKQEVSKKEGAEKVPAAVEQNSPVQKADAEQPSNKRRPGFLQLILLLLHLLVAAAVILHRLNRLGSFQPLLIPAAAILAAADFIFLLQGNAAFRQTIRRFRDSLTGTDNEKDGADEHSDDQTVLLTAGEAAFRMAMLSEGQPGTPAEHEGQRAFILVEEFVIGRDPKKCDLCLPDASVGRLHARIFRRAGSFFICDLGSGNGTQLDSRRLPKHTECLLPDQCLLQFAERSFYFHAD